MRHELLTRDELADRFGVDVRTITNWVQAGMPQRKRSGQVVYSWQECRDWREERIREDARSTRHAGGDESKALEMAELKLREQRALTEQAELDVAERRSALVTLEFMETEFQRIANGLRSRMLTIPASWEGPLAGCSSAVDRQLTLQSLVNEILPLLGAAADDDGEGDEAHRGDDVDEDDEDDGCAGGAVAVR